MLEGVRRYSGQVFLDGEDGMYLHAYDVADAWSARLAAIREALEAERVVATNMTARENHEELGRTWAVLDELLVAP